LLLQFVEARPIVEFEFMNTEYAGNEMAGPKVRLLAKVYNIVYEKKLVNFQAMFNFIVREGKVKLPESFILEKPAP